MADDKILSKTPLHNLHVANGGRMVSFAGYSLPVQYQGGIVKEHLHTRKAAGLFDVSHMGQLEVSGENRAAALERLVPADVRGLAQGQVCYSQFTNLNGGILDDLLISNNGDRLGLVVNAACKDSDIKYLEKHLPEGCDLHYRQKKALLALQGPKTVQVLKRHCDIDFGQFGFMTCRAAFLFGVEVILSRTGYTGEDGFEISVDGEKAERIAECLLVEKEVQLAGLGARDSLRLEAGLCLYGQDLDESTTPVEAKLEWSIGARRRNVGDFIGADVVLEQLASGAKCKRVGLAPEGRAILRGGTQLRDSAGIDVGKITSGGFSPTLGSPMAMGYVASACAEIGTKLFAELRGKTISATVVPMPMVQTQYFRIKKMKTSGD